MQFRGVVAKRTVARGSKSEHAAVVLRTDDEELVLRRRGGNAFRDDVLEALVGKTVEITGDVDGHTLIIEGVRERRR